MRRPIIDDADVEPAELNRESRHVLRDALRQSLKFVSDGAVEADWQRLTGPPRFAP
jgi:hypothetical protein